MNWRSGTALLAAVFTLVSSASASGRSAADDRRWLDPSFGYHGKVTYPIPLAPAVVRVQPNGEIVLLGNVGDAPGTVYVVRLYANGHLDIGFGASGAVKLSMSTAKALTLLSSGDILVGGADTSGRHAELVRLRTDGSLDRRFGKRGIVDFDYVPNSSNGTFVTLEQPDGKILAGGFGIQVSSDEYLTSLARFNENGTADGSFGKAGIRTVNAVGGITAMGLQADGKILVCGGFVTAATSLVMRFLRDGRVDAHDTGGSLAQSAHAGSLTLGTTNAFTPEGKLVQWRSIVRRNGNYVQVVRLLRDGQADPLFASRTFAFGASTFNMVNDVELASSGKLLVGGAGTAAAGRTVFGIAAIDRDGRFQRGFGTDGRVLTAFGTSAEASALAIAPDGKLVAAGVRTQGSQSWFVVARYLEP